MELELYNENQRFISLLSDYGFKVTFGNESDTKFLKKALQALIDSPIPICEISFVQNEIRGLTKDSRSGIYDIACTDELGNHFIVEMQLSEYLEFLHRMKFYAFHRFNTLVKKGKYTFENLPRIYCIAFLDRNILTNIQDYHNIAVLRNVKGELIDDQMTFITVELAKFDKRLTEIQSDLDKLIYTMKNLHKVTRTSQFPPFWNEEWLKIAIEDLDKKKLTPEQKLAYEMTISANALAIKNENKRVEQIKIDAIKNLLSLKLLSIEQIANTVNVSVDFVLGIQQELNQK